MNDIRLMVPLASENGIKEVQVNENRRILVIDDDPGVRESYRSILVAEESMNVVAMGAALFGEPGAGQCYDNAWEDYAVTLCESGEAGLTRVKDACQRERPFALAFVDMNMPGMNGADTAKRIWEADPCIKIVIVTAYSEYTPDEIVDTAGREELFYLRKPYNSSEIKQFARALTRQWDLEQDRKRLAACLHRTNQKLKELNRSLEKNVKEKTAQLIQAEKLSSLGVLVAGVAHEINNPLSFVNNNLSFMQQHLPVVLNLIAHYRHESEAVRKKDLKTAATQAAAISQIETESRIDFLLKGLADSIDESLDGAERISTIVNDLRAFARTECAKTGAADINTLLDTTVNILRNELKYKVELIKDYKPLPQVTCYPQKLGQLFMNIIMNAIQAIKEKGTITIATAVVEKGDGSNSEWVKITICDSGKGIPEADLPNIFDPFYTTKPVGQGTGLGLSIAYEIVQLNGGFIGVESIVGKGSTVTIELPPGPNTDPA